MMSRTWIAVTVFWLTLGGTTGPIAAQQPRGLIVLSRISIFAIESCPAPSAAGRSPGGGRCSRPKRFPRQHAHRRASHRRRHGPGDRARTAARGDPRCAHAYGRTPRPRRVLISSPLRRSATSRARRTISDTSCSARRSTGSVCSMRRFRFIWIVRVESFASRRVLRVDRAAATRV